ncbi:MAG: hypothetical protein GY716_10315 [bacterium]|nr:hypothetical protein [bacterium]
MPTVEGLVYRLVVDKKTGVAQLRAFDKATATTEKKTKRSADRMQKSYRGVDDALQKVTRSANLLVAAVGAAAVAGSIITYKRLTSSVLDVGGSFEFMKTQLFAVTGSLEKANALFDTLVGFAAVTPFETEELVQTSILLEGIGVQTFDMIQTIGDTAGAVGRKISDVTRAFINPQREVLINYGIDLARAGDEWRFKWTDQMGRAQEIVQKGSIEVQRETLAMIWNEKYAGGMEQMSQTYKGLMSTLSDEWTLFQKDISDAGVLEAFKAMVSGVIDLMGELRETGELERVAANISVLILETTSGVISIIDIGTGALLTMIEWAAVANRTWRDFASGVGLILNEAKIEAMSKSIVAFQEDLSGLGQDVERAALAIRDAFPTEQLLGDAIAELDEFGEVLVRTRNVAGEPIVSTVGADVNTEDLRAALEIEQSIVAREDELKSLRAGNNVLTQQAIDAAETQASVHARVAAIDDIRLKTLEAINGVLDDQIDKGHELASQPATPPGPPAAIPQTRQDFIGPLRAEPVAPLPDIPPGFGLDLQDPEALLREQVDGVIRQVDRLHEIEADPATALLGMLFNVVDPMTEAKLEFEATVTDMLAIGQSFDEQWGSIMLQQIGASKIWADSLVSSFQSIGSMGQSLDQIVGDHTAFAKGMKKLQAGMLLVTGTISLFEGGQKLAAGLFPPNPPLIASGAAMVAEGLSSIAAAKRLGAPGGGGRGGGRGGGGGGGRGGGSAQRAANAGGTPVRATTPQGLLNTEPGTGETPVFALGQGDHIEISALDTESADRWLRESPENREAFVENIALSAEES